MIWEGMSGSGARTNTNRGSTSRVLRGDLGPVATATTSCRPAATSTSPVARRAYVGFRAVVEAGSGR